MELILTDSSGSLTLPQLSPPFETEILEGATDVQTLDNNISTYFTANKVLFKHTWPYMSEENYTALMQYYHRQWTDYKYPLLTFEYLNVENLPVRMSVSPLNLIDKCGTMENVTITLRETRQLP